MAEMKTLINNIKTFLETAITAGNVNATTVIKGLNDDPSYVATAEYPYIMIDDGGERTESNDSQASQMRYYSVIIECGCYSLTNVSAAMDECLDLVDEVKTELEKEVNRQLDGFLWGISIVPFSWDSEGTFFRGRQIVIDWYVLEDTIDIY